MDGEREPTTTAAEVLARGLAALGVTRIFGVPGGGASLEIIAAAAAAGVPFTLARQETAAVMMATATAEVTGRPGVALVSRGPGLSAAATGLAHAGLDRAPVLLLTDGFTQDERGWVTHQVFDQAGLAAPLVRAQTASTGDDVAPCLARLAAAMEGPCRGPALLELTDAAARRRAAPGAPPERPTLGSPNAASVAAARRLLAASQRPAIIVGLEACEASAELRALAEALAAPVLVTYKAKGVLADEDRLFGGVFTGGEAEAALLRRADVILLAGADPVEFIPQPWRYAAPVIDVARFRRPRHYIEPACVLDGPVPASVAALVPAATRSVWTEEEIATARAAWRARVAAGAAAGRIGPDLVVSIAAEACAAAGLHPRVTIDAGAHMFSATSLWPARAPGDVLISNGLATMGFALPAAIGAALAEPARRVLAFTGDGGLSMCLGELATAAAAGAAVIVIVFNDGGLSLIDIKKGGRAVPDDALAWPRADFAAVARGLGCDGFRAGTPEEYRDALARALGSQRSAVIDVQIDSSGYPAQIAGVRG
jgi:acetolactate synthase-1/2/3 large subunit